MSERRTYTKQESYARDLQKIKFIDDRIKNIRLTQKKDSRKERTHLLCQIGGSVLKHFPGIEGMEPDMINDLIYRISKNEDVRRQFEQQLLQSVKREEDSATVKGNISPL